MAFRISVAILITAGLGLIVGIGYFMFQLVQADENPPGSDNPTAWIIMLASVVVGVIATAAAMFTDLKKRSADVNRAGHKEVGGGS